MSITPSKLKEKLPSPQKRYREAQQQKGVVRYEIQISETAKAKFEEVVSAVADEYTLPYSDKARKAKARAQVFEEITTGVIHQFTELENKIDDLKAEIKALSPSFFITPSVEKTPLPEAIAALPDNPEQLKKILAKVHQENQHLKVSCLEYQRQANQFEQLYNTFYTHNEQLENELKKQNL